MRGKQIGIVGFLLVLFIVNSINVAATKETNLVFVRSDIGFSRACSYYEIKNYGLGELQEDKLKTLKLGDSIVLKNKGYTNGIKEVIGKIKNNVWEYSYTETYDCSHDRWVSNIACETVYNPVNETYYEDCTDNGYSELVEKDCERELWINAEDEKLKNIKIKPSGDLQVRFCADIEREFTKDGWTIRVDHIPEFDGIEYKEYAWWDISYGFRYADETNVTALPNIHAIADNRTFGNSYTVWTANATAGENRYVYCTVSGCATGDFAIANETDEVPWEMDNMTGNDVSVLWEDMYSEYHMDTLNDSAPYSMDCTYAGTHTSVAGVYGNGRTFAADTVSTCTFEVMAPASLFTITWWAKMANTDDGQNIWKDLDQGIYVTTGGGNKWYVGTYDGGWPAITANVDFNIWYHYALVWNGTDNLFYINSVLNATAAAGNHIAVGGGPYSDYIGQAVQGTLDELRIYNNTALTATQIQEEYYNRGNISSLGSEEVSPVIPPEVFINFTMLSPDNTTYGTTSITINGTVNDTANVTWSEDGGANQTACEICTDFENITTLAEGGHDVHVYAVFHNNSSVVNDSQIFFLIDLTAPTITIEDPTGTYVTNTSIPLNYNASDSYSAISACWRSLNNGTNTSLAGCANTTFAVTQAGTHNISVYANDSMDWIGVNSNSFIYDPLQNFTANDSLSEEQIQNFQVLIIEPSVDVSTANGTAPVLSSAIGYGARTVRFIATGYNTTDFDFTFTNETILAENFTLVPASVNITVYDEADAALGVTTNITFNITISNDTQSNTWYNESTFFKYANETASGAVTISISSYGYQPRQYYVTINENIANNFIAYLLKTADSLFVRMHILTIDGVGITTATVTAERQIGGIWTLMEEKTTDDSGVAGLSLAPFSTYRIIASASGYETQVRSIMPSASDYYFYMEAVSTIAYHTLFENITYSLTPENPILQVYEVYDFVFRINSSDDSLEWFSMNVTYNESMAVFFNNITASAGGGNITYEFNETNMSGNYTVELRFKKTDWPMWNASFVYRIMNVTAEPSSIWGVLTGLKGSDMSPFFLNLAAIFVAFLGAGGVSRTGMSGGGFVALGILIIFTLAGWFAWEMMLLSGLTLLAVAFLQGKL